MPQASDELRARWSHQSAGKFLEAAGYKLTAGFAWLPPSRTHLPTGDERQAIGYLIDEWDYGPVIRVSRAD